MIMSKLCTEIKTQILTCVSRDEQSFTYELRFSSDFIGFNGHFPGTPVLPGFCQVQTVLTLLGLQPDIDPWLIEVVRSKFIEAIGADETVTFTCEFIEKSVNELLITSKVLKGEKIISKIVLKVSNSYKYVEDVNGS